MPVHILVGTRTLCGLDPAWENGGWDSTVDSYVHHENTGVGEVNNTATCTECREVYHRRAMNELGYGGLDQGPINIAPNRHEDPPMEEPALDRLWARPDEGPPNTPETINPWHVEPVLNLQQAQERIEVLEAWVNRLRTFVSTLTLALGEHILIPSVAGDSEHAIRMFDWYGDQGKGLHKLLRTCLEGDERVYPLLVPYEGTWLLLFRPEVLDEKEDAEGPPTAWDRIKSDD